MEKFSIHPLVREAGHWMKYVAQGYVDRWGCTEVQSWAPPSGIWPGFQVVIVVETRLHREITQMPSARLAVSPLCPALTLSQANSQSCQHGRVNKTSKKQNNEWTDPPVFVCLILFHRATDLCCCPEGIASNNVCSCTDENSSRQIDFLPLL